MAQAIESIARMAQARLSTGIERLDELLGGGLLPGTLTVALGATGIGKTQLGLQFAQAGQQQEGQTGILFDLTSRGDAQNHAEYAARMFDWPLRVRTPETLPPVEALWRADEIRSDYFHLFDRAGRRVTRQDMEHDDWQLFKIELNRKLEQSIAFFYGNFVHGVRRCVIDGVEPVERASESFQFHVFDYIYHQILHKDHDWVARDLLRAQYRTNEPDVMAHSYDHRQIGTLLLATSHEVLLDDLLSRPIESGDVLANANTILLMGKIRDGRTMRRALQVAKHRGSACREDIVFYDINDRGLVLCDD